MPDYLAVFGLGLVASVVIGIISAVVWDVKTTTAIGNVMLLYGGVLLLVGGATGGGYASVVAGAARALVTTRPPDEPKDIKPVPGEPARLSPREQMRSGFRPEASPTSFWQVIGGFAYLGIAILIIMAFA